MSPFEREAVENADHALYRAVQRLRNELRTDAVKSDLETALCCVRRALRGDQSAASEVVRNLGAAINERYGGGPRRAKGGGR